MQRTIYNSAMTEKTFEQEIADFCHANSLSGRMFGTLAFSDPTFWFKLTRGRDPKLTTVERARAFMANYNRETEGSA